MNFWDSLVVGVGYLLLSLLCGMFLGSLYSSRMLNVKIKAVFSTFLHVGVTIWLFILYSEKDTKNGIIMFIGLFSFYAFVVFLKDDKRYLKAMEVGDDKIHMHFLTPFAVSKSVDLEYSQITEISIPEERSLYYYPLSIRINYKGEDLKFRIVDRALAELLEDKLTSLKMLVKADKVHT